MVIGVTVRNLFTFSSSHSLLTSRTTSTSHLILPTFIIHFAYRLTERRTDDTGEELEHKVSFIPNINFVSSTRTRSHMIYCMSILTMGLRLLLRLLLHHQVTNILKVLHLRVDGQRHVQCLLRLVPLRVSVILQRSSSSS